MTLEEQRPAEREALLGLALLSPAFIALVWSYLIPTATVLVKSFRGRTGSMVEGYGPTDWVGTKNYGAATSHGFFEQVGNALVIAVIPVVMAVVVAPLLAAVARRAGSGGRRLTRSLLVVPVAGWLPTTLALGWLIKRTDAHDLRDHLLLPVAWGTGVITSALVLALAATVFLAVRPPLGSSSVDSSARRRATWVAGTTLGLSIVAISLQGYRIPVLVGFLTYADDPGTLPLSGLVALTNVGAAVLLLAALAVLGTALVWILLATRARIEWEPPSPEPVTPETGRPRRAAWLPLLVGLLLVAALIAYVYSLIFAAYDGLPAISAGEIMRNGLREWLPPVIAAVVSVGIGALGGYGIGALRPFGRHSESLLLVFAPWLLVGIGPLSAAYTAQQRSTDHISTLREYVPTIWLCIPALVVFTLFFRGRRGQGATTGELVRSALPLLGLALVLNWLVSYPQSALGDGGQDLTATARGLWVFAGRFFVLLVLLIVAQVTYVDRLAFRVDARRAPEQPEVSVASARSEADPPASE